jgi:hypothetical protein
VWIASLECTTIRRLKYKSYRKKNWVLHLKTLPF